MKLVIFLEQYVLCDSKITNNLCKKGKPYKLISNKIQDGMLCFRMLVEVCK